MAVYKFPDNWSEEDWRRADAAHSAIADARHREIAQRYRDRAKRKGHKKPLTLAAVRVAELTRLYDHRYGRMLLPSTDEGILAARIMVHHIGHLKDAPRRITSWFQACTPWLGLASRERLIRDAMERPIKWRADKLAWKLKVTAAERAGLGLRTIGAIDMTKEQRAAAAKERKRLRDQARHKRRRAEYEASATARAKPWQALGMSRASWYRAGKPIP
jgi:hypothetical protein